MHAGETVPAHGEREEIMRLLFAEDDRDLSAAVKTLLERNGYLVDAVYDGDEAVSYAGAEDYD